MPHSDCPLKQAALEAPHRIALVTPQQQYTFLTLNAHVDSLCQQFERKGINPGDRIATLFPQDASFVFLFWVAYRMRFVLCPLSTRLPPLQIQKALDQLQARCLLSSLAQISSIELASSATPSPEELFLLLFTSGSTAQPKIAGFSFRQLLKSAEGVLFVLPLDPSDRWQASLPFFHVGGIGILLRCLLMRAAITFDKQDPLTTHLSAVPAQLFPQPPSFPKLRCLLLGGAPIFRVPPNLPVFTTYGLTEMSSCVTLHHCQTPPPFSAGHPLPYRSLRISSEGEIQVKGECLFLGYWEEGTLTLPLDAEGWFATKDQGIYCPQQGLFVQGRKDWQFISGGENIQPEEIEQELSLLPFIREAAIFPVKDPRFGERPAAMISAPLPVSLAKIHEALCTRLPKYKLPVALLQVPRLPRQGMKLNRKKIFEIWKNHSLANPVF